MKSSDNLQSQKSKFRKRDSSEDILEGNGKIARGLKGEKIEKIQAAYNNVCVETASNNITKKIVKDHKNRTTNIKESSVKKEILAEQIEIDKTIMTACNIIFREKRDKEIKKGEIKKVKNLFHLSENYKFELSVSEIAEKMRTLTDDSIGYIKFNMTNNPADLYTEIFDEPYFEEELQALREDAASVYPFDETKQNELAEVWAEGIIFNRIISEIELVNLLLEVAQEQNIKLIIDDIELEYLQKNSIEHLKNIYFNNITTNIHTDINTAYAELKNLKCFDQKLERWEAVPLYQNEYRQEIITDRDEAKKEGTMVGEKKQEIQSVKAALDVEKQTGVKIDNESLLLDKLYLKQQDIEYIRNAVTTSTDDIYLELLGHQQNSEYINH